MSIVFLGIAGYFGMYLYESWRDGDWLKSGPAAEQSEAAEEQLAYPARLNIKSTDGRELSIKLVARSSTHIQFERELDGERFVYPLAQLVTASRQLVEAYPNSGLEDAGKHIGESGLGFEDAYVEQLREGIKRINEKLEKLNLDYQKTESKTEQRTIYRKVQDMTRDRTNLEAKIAERQ